MGHSSGRRQNNRISGRLPEFPGDLGRLVMFPVIFIVAWIHCCTNARYQYVCRRFCWYIVSLVEVFLLFSDLLAITTNKQADMSLVGRFAFATRASERQLIQIGKHQVSTVDKRFSYQ